MKLVNAKCPNCGANIEVSSDAKSVICRYCGSDVLVEDAVEKYKLEISGQVEISNSNKVNNLLMLADRNYNNKDYENAYKNYKLVLELEPNNTIAILKHGLSKTRINNYIDFGMEYLIQALKDAIQIEEDKNGSNDNIVVLIQEVVNVIDESLKSTRKYYNSYTLTESDVTEVQKKLISIFNAYEYVVDYSDNDDNKKHIYLQIISVLKDIIREKKYKSGHDEFGGNVIKIYSIKENKQYYLEKLDFYRKLTNTEEDDDDLKINYHNAGEKNKWIALCLCIFFGWIGAHKIYEGKLVMAVLYFFTFGLFCIGWWTDIVLLLMNPNPYYPKKS